MQDLIKTDPYATLRIPEFRAFLFAKSLSTVANLMINTVLAWYLYDVTGSKVALGMIGLSEALPYIIATFFSGPAADRYNRKRVLQFSTFGLLIASVILAFGSWWQGRSMLIEWYYFIIAFMGVCRSFMTPASMAIQSRIVPRELYANSSTWSSNSFQVSAVLAPILAGLLLEKIAAYWVFSICALVLILAFYHINKLDEHYPPVQHDKEPFVRSFFGGIKFVFGTQAILSSITLDLFAVLFGGVIGLVPAFCKDILHVGPTMMGMLRSSQFLGSAVMGFALAHYPPTRHAGINLLVSIGAFGLCIIGFAISPYYWLSFTLLFLSGAFDGVSVIIRSTIIQTFTSDAMRGRVAAVNSIFIKSSNEIGDFESGIAASYFGLAPAVIFGGIVTLAVVAGTAVFAPTLRKMKL